ncbi:MAG: hypothetical protein P4L61_03070 [Candidatus Pacebacteria bacterium]|nr:hypothetical protein [Candidatus Paceibacterota bacterium]
MRSFLQIITAVLQDEPEIAELPTSKLIGINDGKATLLGRDIPQDVMFKLARLQTLKVKEAERGEMPELDELKAIGGDTKVAMASSLGILEDSTRRIIMLERLIVEVVREAFPTECDRLDVEYMLHPQKGIIFVPTKRQRFLD